MTRSTPALAEETACAVLDDLVREGVVPGGAAAVVSARGVTWSHVFGARATWPEPEPMTRDTIFDLASLTKPLVTATLALKLRAEGRLRFETSVAELVPELASGPGVPRPPTVAELLVHAGGMPAWEPLYAQVPGGTLADRARFLAGRRGEPGRSSVYSDTGYQVLGLALERATSRPLTELARDVALRGPGLDGEAWFPLPARLAARAAPTEAGNARERELAGDAAAGYEGFRTGLIRGETHDHCAFTLGGAAGHAGLFATLAGAATLAARFLAPGPAFTAQDLQEIARPQGPAPGPEGGELRTWGFQCARSASSCAGEALSDRAFVHAGFTGTSVAVDPDRRAAYVLLTNRIHPRWTPRAFHADRARFHAAAAALVEAHDG